MSIIVVDLQSASWVDRGGVGGVKGKSMPKEGMGPRRGHGGGNQVGNQVSNQVLNSVYGSIGGPWGYRGAMGGPWANQDFGHKLRASSTC